MITALNRTALISTAANFSVDAIPSGNYAADAAAGNLVVTAPISVASGASLNLLSDNRVAIDAPITVAGSGGLILGAPLASGFRMLNFSSGGYVQYTGAEGSGQTLNMYGTNYTLIFTLLELQGLQNTLTGNYALAGNIDATATSGWNSGAGFVPIGSEGSPATPFTGTFDGLGNVISNLTINGVLAYGAGLFGAVGSGGALRDVGLSNASIIELSTHPVGALAGYNYGTIGNSWVTGSVSRSDGEIGGLVGENIGAISDSYSTAAVTANTISTTKSGGLVGANVSGGTISNSYATGTVIGTGGNITGGLVGMNSASTISDSYATGSVTGGISVGGLAGANSGGTVTNSFWDTTTSGQATSAAGTGMTTAQMRTQANFTSATSANGSVNPGWDFANTWTMYDGHTYPLLRSFMTPLTVTANSASKTYDGLAYSGGNGVSYSISGATLSGAASYSGTSQGAINAGSFVITPSGLYSGQQGYLISYVSGALTVNQKAITVTAAGANKVYDGNVNDAATLSSSGVISGDVVNFTDTSATFADKNVGNGKTVSVAGIAASGSDAGNYSFNTTAATTANITPASLSVTGESAGSKVYDGNTTASLSGGSLSGIISGDSVTLAQSGSFASKNAGTNISVAASDSLGGTDAGNYMLTQPSGLSANITQKSIAVTAAGANRTYDGTVNDAATLSSSGVISGDVVNFTDTAATFADKNVGNGKTVTVSNISASGVDAGNYSFNTAASTMANITPATLSYVAASKYILDGQSPSGLSGTVTGFFGGDDLANSTAGTPVWTTTATSSSHPGLYPIDGGGLTLTSSNYVLAQSTGNATALTLVGTPPENVISVVATEQSFLTSQPVDEPELIGPPFATPEIYLIERLHAPGLFTIVRVVNGGLNTIGN